MAFAAGGSTSHYLNILPSQYVGTNVGKKDLNVRKGGLWLCVGVCVCVCVYVCVCVCAWVCGCVCGCMSVHKCVCAYMYIVCVERVVYAC